MALPQLLITLGTLGFVALLDGCAVAPPSGTTPALPSATLASPSAPSMPPAFALAGTEWVAFAIDGKAEVLNPKPRLRWLAADKFTGTGGCNGFTGSSVGILSNLRLGPLVSTGRVCLSMPGSQEDLFFKALELTRRAQIERDQLVLMDESGKPLARFLRAN